MNKTAEKHCWSFAPRFRRGAFGWRSDPAITRTKEAIAEIKAVSRKDPLLAAEGAVLFLQKISPALQNIDSSSGAIGNSVNRAIEALVPIISKAPAEMPMRRKWLEQISTEPLFALNSGLMALYWICAGRAYDPTTGEILTVYNLILSAAEVAQCKEAALTQIRNMREGFPQDRLVKGALARAAGLWDVDPGG